MTSEMESLSCELTSAVQEREVAMADARRYAEEEKATKECYQQVVVQHGRCMEALEEARVEVLGCWGMSSRLQQCGM